MQLEKVAARIRPRGHWEAVDLGFAMVREWARPVYAAWLVTVLPVFVAATLFAQALDLSLGVLYLMVWWLRPLYDRVPLFVLSRALFGATPTLRETLAALPALLKGHLLPALLLLRLDAARSFQLPVFQLEGLRGGDRRRRAAVLARDGRAHAVGLTMACSMFELGLLSGLVGLASMTLPAATFTALSESMSEAMAGKATFWHRLLFAALLLLPMSAVEPFYVAGGFSLYLNRRTKLEGWDVEIAFRRLAKRLSPLATTAAVLVLLVAAAPLSAQPDQRRRPTREEVAASLPPPQRAIAEILATPDFQTTEKHKVWREKSPRKGEDPKPSRDGFSFGDATLFRWVFRILFFLVLAAVLAFGIRELLRIRRRPPPVETLVPGEIRTRGAPALRRTVPLPDDVAGEALRLFEAGEHAAALGLLYRGALAWFVTRSAVRMPESATEGESLRLVRQRAAGESVETFARVVLAWQTTAFGHAPPSREEFARLVDGFRKSFVPAREGPA